MTDDPHDPMQTAFNGGLYEPRDPPPERPQDWGVAVAWGAVVVLGVLLLAWLV